MRADDVLSSSSPRLGMPSSLSATVGSSVHHPGPTEFWLLHPIAKSGWPVVMLTALFNLTCIVTTCLAIRAMAGTRTATVAATCATAMCAALGGYILIDPRNPYFATFALTAFLGAASAAGAGRARWLPIAVVFSSLAAQAQLSAAAVVVGGAVGAAAAWRRVGRHVGSNFAKSFVASSVIATFLWWPVLWDQLTGTGNLTALVRGAGASADRISLGMALDSLAVGLSWWFGGAEILRLVYRPPPAWVYPSTVALLAAFVGVLLVGIRRRASWSAGVIVLAGATLAGSLALSRLPDQPTSVLALTNYLWLWPVAAGTSTTMIAPLVQQMRSHSVDVAIAAVAVVVAGLSVVAPIRPATFTSTAAVEAALPVLEERLDANKQYLFIVPDEFERFDITAGLVRGLRLAHIHVVVPPTARRSFADRSLASDDRPTGILSVGLGVEQGPNNAIVIYESNNNDGNRLTVWLRPWRHEFSP